MTDESWEGLAAALAAKIPYLRDQDTLILESDDRYVQFQQAPAALHVEAVANNALPAERQIRPDAEQRLAQLGWNAPTPPGQHNWWRKLAWPPGAAESRELADVLVTTLREVYEVPSPQQLSHQAFNAGTSEKLDFGVPDDEPTPGSNGP
ncbi:TY-Chap domain-containing protein [Planosporangium mesophilum]|uniref:TY-Chap N-terminal domain-containing protein n=1 Tax=Planosporangium mesophilum TaxID=689768 RepID=A0A8J3TD56_9ACTN|nr:hypothetical protein [Planosporangium mesophilum]NJC86688.1 hypothetical protein [Planosporangium mesophilum]GII24114.1 hypothetical protein Pme01_37110 [Planosporangium mesophilum]